MFKCQFPSCMYETTDRNLIDHHHVVPREHNGSDLTFNKIWLCPNHHRLIYIPGSKKGMHSIQKDGSIIIKNIYQSTGGKVLEYEQLGETKLVKLNN